MKNKEKYPNTDDALKAFEEHKKKCNCDCTFEDWLDLDEDKTKEFVDKLDGLFAASLLGPIGLGLLAGLKRRQDKDAKPKSDSAKSKPGEGNGDEIKGVECPLCHGKNGRIDGYFFPGFRCPDCDALISKRTDVVRAPFGNSSPDEFKAWFGKLTSAAKKN